MTLTFFREGDKRCIYQSNCKTIEFFFNFENALSTHIKGRPQRRITATARITCVMHSPGGYGTLVAFRRSGYLSQKDSHEKSITSTAHYFCYGCFFSVFFSSYRRKFVAISHSACMISPSLFLWILLDTPIVF